MRRKRILKYFKKNKFQDATTVIALTNVMVVIAAVIIITDVMEIIAEVIITTMEVCENQRNVEFKFKFKKYIFLQSIGWGNKPGWGYRPGYGNNIIGITGNDNRTIVCINIDIGF